ncbi:MAG: hypothetical protein ABIH86_00810 [Planctomycetota bacterium]
MSFKPKEPLFGFALALLILSVGLIAASAYYIKTTPSMRREFIIKNIHFTFDTAQPPGEKTIMIFRAKIVPGARIDSIALRSNLLNPTEHRYDRLNLSGTMVKMPLSDGLVVDVMIAECVLSHIQIADAPVGAKDDVVVEILGRSPAQIEAERNSPGAGGEAMRDVARFPLEIAEREMIASIERRLKRSRMLFYYGLGGIGLGLFIAYVHRSEKR